MTRRYTCTWPTVQQQWLFEHDTKAWLDGLPPYVRAFMKTKAEAISNASVQDKDYEQRSMVVCIRDYFRKQLVGPDWTSMHSAGRTL